MKILRASTLASGMVPVKTWLALCLLIPFCSVFLHELISSFELDGKFTFKWLFLTLDFIYHCLILVIELYDSFISDILFNNFDLSSFVIIWTLSFEAFICLISLHSSLPSFALGLANSSQII